MKDPEANWKSSQWSMLDHLRKKGGGGKEKKKKKKKEEKTKYEINIYEFILYK